MSLFNIVFYTVIGVLVLGLIIAIPFLVKAWNEFKQSMDRIEFMTKNPIWKW